MKYSISLFVLGCLLSFHVAHAELPEMESVGIKLTRRLDFSVTGEVEAPVGGSLVYLRSVKVSATTSSPKSYLISGLLVDGNAGGPVVNHPLSVSAKEDTTSPVFAGMTNALGEFVIRVWVEEKINKNSGRVSVGKDFEGYLYLGRFPSPWDINSFPINGVFPVYGVGGGVIRYDLSKLRKSFGPDAKAEQEGADQPATALEPESE